jgi:hypothetical protein
VFGNHSPSRSRGQFESDGYRAIAGETLGYFHQRVLEVNGLQTPVLAMEDFNNEPFDPPWFETRSAFGSEQRSPLPGGSAFVESDVADRRRARCQLLIRQPVQLLDQFLVNKNVATRRLPIKIDPATVQIFKLPRHGQSRFLSSLTHVGLPRGRADAVW